LNFRKLTPALFNLFIDGWMPDKYAVVGIARSDYSDDDYRKHLLEGIQEFSRRKDQGGQWDGFAKNISYLNCETEHGKTSQYNAMILAANKYVRKEAPVPVIVYNFQLSANTDSIQLAEGESIYFGDRKIGTVRKKPAGQGTGQMEISNKFPLYDNMDFFYFSSRPDDPRKIELRIDPTRSRKLVDPARAIVPVKLMK